MSQFARPDADVTNQGFVDAALGSTNVFASIDEVSARDDDYIASPLAPANKVYVCSLSDVVDPGFPAYHVVRYRYCRSAPGGATIGLVVELRQGYVSEGTPGTLITSHTHAGISNIPVTCALTLSDAEANAITDYTALFLRFVFNQTT